MTDWKDAVKAFIKSQGLKLNFIQQWLLIQMLEYGGRAVQKWLEKKSQQVEKAKEQKP